MSSEPVSASVSTQQPPTPQTPERTWDELAAKVARDAADDSAKYLDETRVPYGGE